MSHGLPRRIKLAFIVQSLIASILVTLGVLIVGLMVRQSLLQERLNYEADAFWRAHAADASYAPPHGASLRGYLQRPGDDWAAVPEDLRGMTPGIHELPGYTTMVFVDQREGGTLYLRQDASLVNSAIFWTGGVSLLLALLVMYLSAWLTYRTSKRVVTPVSWLANVVAHWDPRNPDANALLPEALPGDSGMEVRRLSRALRGLAGRIGEFVQRERDFTRDASHELRTPLTVIRVATDMLLGDPELPPRMERSLARVQRAGRDMEAVIDAFLILAREAEIEPQSEEFPVRDIVQEEIDRVRPLLADRPIELIVTDRGAPHLFAPRRVLNVMLGNLLNNAARFTERGRIELVLADDRVEVRDSGIGMAPEVLAKAFDPFYRADPHRPDGKGIGLSIVRRLGDRFRWPVTLASTPGQGTTATIHFAGG